MKNLARMFAVAGLAMAVTGRALAQQDGTSAVPGTPDLKVASVTAQHGLRASKIIGAAVYNGGNQEIGTVDDLIVNGQGKAMLAVIAVGGFLGVGSKLVAEPYAELKFDGSGKVVLAEASKDSLNKQPNFTYAP